MADIDECLGEADNFFKTRAIFTLRPFANKVENVHALSFFNYDSFNYKLYIN